MSKPSKLELFLLNLVTTGVEKGSLGLNLELESWITFQFKQPWEKKSLKWQKRALF